MFPYDESKAPEVISLRLDFPQTPHQLISSYDFLKSICLFEETNDELVLNWTPTMLLRRIGQWMALTAEGRLHGEDQPLE